MLYDQDNIQSNNQEYWDVQHIFISNFKIKKNYGKAKVNEFSLSFLLISHHIFISVHIFLI